MATTPIAARNVRKLFLILLFTATTPLAAWAAPEMHFQRGMAAYRAGDYGAAAQAFEQARAERLRRPALDYNLGSTYFRLGQYERAGENFRRLLQVPALAPLAHYNLGLVALRQDNTALANSHFRIAYDSATDERLRYLAARKLELAADSVDEDPYDWRAYASLATGYDDNVNFAPTDMPTYRGDLYGEAYFSGSGVLSGNRDEGVSLHGSLYALRYEDLDENDYTQLRAEARRNAVLGDWYTYAGGFALSDRLGGDPFQRGLGVEAGASRELAENRYLHLRYTYEDMNSLDDQYDYLAGRRQELRAEFAIHQARDSVRLAYELELNDRRDTELESYSPLRHSVHAYYTYDLDADWRLRADASYRLSDYPSAPLLDRQDKRWRTRLSASHFLTNDWLLTGRWEYTSNQSNDPLRDYERNVYSLELQWLF